MKATMDKFINELNSHQGAIMDDLERGSDVARSLMLSVHRFQSHPCNDSFKDLQEAFEEWKSSRKTKITIH